MSKTVEIGTWHEAESREITHCPSYYVADTETLRIKSGDYTARLTFEAGYIIPMPYWLLVGIDCERVDGRLYSGFGGLNFASTELPRGEDVRYVIRAYVYQIPELVKSGKLTINEKYNWLLSDLPCWRHPDAPKTWEEL